jgi:acetyltransferase
MKDPDDWPAGVRLRAALPSDIDAVQRFVAALSLRSRVQRFFAPLRELPAGLASALQRNDPSHRFVVAERDGEIVGLGQYAVDAGGERCEVALVIDDRVQGLGLGRRLLARLLADAAGAGLRQAVLETLAGNAAMRALARRCGFELERHPEDPDLVLGRRPLVAT